MPSLLDLHFIIKESLIYLLFSENALTPINLFWSSFLSDRHKEFFHLQVWLKIWYLSMNMLWNVIYIYIYIHSVAGRRCCLTWMKFCLNKTYICLFLYIHTNYSFKPMTMKIFSCFLSKFLFFYILNLDLQSS